MQSQHLSQYLTGHYKASVEYDDHQYLKLTVEVRPSIVLSDDLTNLLYREVIEGLCEFQHEFKEDYEEIYKNLMMILIGKYFSLTLCKWPVFSQELLEKTKEEALNQKITLTEEIQEYWLCSLDKFVKLTISILTVSNQILRFFSSGHLLL